MERLTVRDDYDRARPRRTVPKSTGHGRPCEMFCHLDVEGNCRGCPIQEAFDRLADYEDSGLMPDEFDSDIIQNAYDELAEYEDAEERGRLIEFPVAVGDHVWCFPSEAEPYREMQVVGLSCDFGAKYVQVQDVITTETVYFNTENLGRSMFISREQAEAKLKEMEVDSHGDS